MIIKPIATEKAIRLIEIENTLIFQVNSSDDKKNIKKDAEELFKVKVEKVNIMNRGTKKVAYIKLDKAHQAIDVATKLGLI